MELISRQGYLRWLDRWRDQAIIKAVTGIRRCGKSTLLTMFAQRLEQSGVPPERIIQLNLEDLTLAQLAGDHLALYQFIHERLQPDAMNYVFIDEVQQVPLFERLLDGLFILPNVDLYVTGSNTDLLGGKLATLLTGRYVELSLLPLSFAEYASVERTGSDGRPLSRDAVFATYLSEGGFPFVARLRTATERREYLSSVTDTVLLRDVVERLNVANVGILRNVTEFVLDSIGAPVSPKSIADTMTSRGRKISSITVDSYLTGLAEAFLLYPVKRYDVKGKRLLERLEKHYAVDTGLRWALTGRSGDTGRQLENIVYLELRRRGWSVTTGKVDKKEIDFVATNRTDTEYFQVSETVLAPETLARELAPLRAVPDFFSRTLLTLDRVLPVPGDGIKVMNVVDWLGDVA
ncbi:MAG: ATP-binding protein [Propionibacteriaceae bacterium]|nr:ATP-binding protein [Propionibacteriaceae bacterium]